MKKWILFLSFMLYGCIQTNFKDSITVIDTDLFEIVMPAGWEYRKHQGDDSFVGEISKGDSTLFFDYSEMGYSWGLEKGKEEYLSSNDWIPEDLFQEKGIIHVAPFSFYEELMNNKEKRMGILEKHKIFTDDKDKIKPFPRTSEFVSSFTKSSDLNSNFEFVGRVEYRGKVEEFEFNVPKKYACNKITYFESDTFYAKLSEPSSRDCGVLGIYFRKKNSSFSFVLYSNGTLLDEDVEEVVKSFKSIRFHNHPVGVLTKVSI